MAATKCGWSAVEKNAVVDVGAVSFRGKGIDGEQWEAATFCGPKGISVLVQKKEGLFEGSEDFWFFASWESLTESGWLKSNDDGTLIDGLRIALRTMLPTEIARDLGMFRS